MRRLNIHLMLSLVAVLSIGLDSLRAEQPIAISPSQATNSTTDEDEQAIRDAAAAFAKAFNAGDAKAIAAQWIEGGVYVNQDGQRFEGREAIQKEYQKFFTAYPGVQIQIKVDSVKVFLTAAFEEGTTTLGSAEVASPVSGRYEAIHVKDNGKWLMAAVRDLHVEVKNNLEKVSDLDAMMGKWIYKNDTTQVEMNCRWMAPGKFAERTFSVTRDGNVTLSGKQIVGWDPMGQQITSWLFDSSGGHDVGIWTPYEDGWAVRSEGVTADGTPTSATTVFKSVGDGEIEWQSVDRMLGDQKLDDTGKMILKRVSK